ncbi:MAG: hypothetical protein M0D54_03765 [Hyphomonadaceae bacterium JAD_PAG50586_4]|nr:MAG: hypothetical protein M0D54_03765 [Hyphomonadaceae bacterium JAD_PAG50586_4]
MSIAALRMWGMTVTGALMAALIVVALQPERAAQAEPQAGFEIAQAPAQAAPVAFLVRFQGLGPIARSQAQAARGQTQAAQRQVELQLQRQSAFAGLCFDRFTVGGAEIVLVTCQAIVASERARVQQQWLARLQAMRAVDYVDANATATQGRAG